MIDILVVCVGNTCRSPMLAGYLQAVYGPNKIVESAGIAAIAGAPAMPQAIAVAEQAGIDLSGHQARKLTPALCWRARWIVAVDPYVARHIERRLRRAPWWYRLVRRAAGRLPVLLTLNVPDPHGGTLQDYRICRRALVYGWYRATGGGLYGDY